MTSRSLTLRLAPRQSAALLFATVGGAAVTAAALGSASGSASSLVTWCRDFVVAASAGRGAAAVAVTVAVGGIAGVAAFRLARFALTEVAASRRFARQVRERALPASGRVAAAQVRARIRAPVTVVRDAEPFAVTVGMRRPGIVLSSAMLSRLTGAELAAVLAHEDAHARARHPLAGVLWESFCRAFFFLPALKDINRHFALTREIAADRAAVAVLGSRPLASALLKAVMPAVTSLPASAAAFGHLQSRITALSGGGTADISLSPLRAFLTAGVGMAVVVLHFALGTAAIAGGPSPGGDRCLTERLANMSEINFSPYFSIRVPEGGTAQMSPVEGLDGFSSVESVQSAPVPAYYELLIP